MEEKVEEEKDLPKRLTTQHTICSMVDVEKDVNRLQTPDKEEKKVTNVVDNES